MMKEINTIPTCIKCGQKVRKSFRLYNERICGLCKQGNRIKNRKKWYKFPAIQPFSTTDYAELHGITTFTARRRLKKMSAKVHCYGTLTCQITRGRKNFYIEKSRKDEWLK